MLPVVIFWWTVLQYGFSSNRTFLPRAHLGLTWLLLSYRCAFILLCLCVFPQLVTHLSCNLLQGLKLNKYFMKCYSMQSDIIFLFCPLLSLNPTVFSSSRQRSFDRSWFSLHIVLYLPMLTLIPAKYTISPCSLQQKTTLCSVMRTCPTLTADTKGTSNLNCVSWHDHDLWCPTPDDRVDRLIGIWCPEWYAPFQQLWLGEMLKEWEQPPNVEYISTNSLPIGYSHFLYLFSAICMV